MDREPGYPLWHGGMTPADLEQRINPARYLTQGKGCWVKDAGGHWLLDARSGLWNLCLGYSCAEVAEAIRRQLDELAFGSLLTYDRPAAVTVDFAAELLSRFPAEYTRIRFGNSGSQIVESALLLSRYLRSGTEPHRLVIVSLRGSYHGTGVGASAVSGVQLGQETLGPLLSEVRCIDPAGGATEALLTGAGPLELVTAVIVEPVLGSGLVLDPPDLAQLERVCRDHRIHLIADEVTTGFGRTGALSRCIDLGLRPDMILLSKGMTAGYIPAAAMLTTAELFASATHEIGFVNGSTTDGHPLAMAAGLAVLSHFDRYDILGNVATMSARLSATLQAVLQEWAPDSAVNAVGLMQILHLRHKGVAWPGPWLGELRECVERAGLLVSQGERCLLVMPPLNIGVSECDEIGARLSAGIAEWSSRR
jgi:beta-alanine--pyruvate transaminase